MTGARYHGSTAAPPTLPPLTSLRGVAAWWVVVFHFREYLLLSPEAPISRFVANGFHAVDLFFILSGFVLQLNYFSKDQPITRISLRQFAVARIARIYPLHIFIMLIFVANPIMIKIFSTKADISIYPISYFLISTALIQNWGFSQSTAYWNVPSWSLSTELGAYLVFPIWVLLKVRIAPLCRSIDYVLCGFLLLGIVCVFHATGVSSLGDKIPSLGMPRCILEFLFGTSLCGIYRQSPGLSYWRSGIIGSVAITLCAAFTFGGVPDYFCLPAAFGCLILLAADTRGPVSSALSNRSMIYLGEISYSTYMVHYFVGDWTGFLLVRDGIPRSAAFAAFIIMTLIASMALYRWIEVPCRRAIRRFAGSPGTPHGSIGVRSQPAEAREAVIDR